MGGYVEEMGREVCRREGEGLSEENEGVVVGNCVEGVCVVGF